MCGICGILGPISSDTISRMVSAIHHRGPDDRGIYQDQSISLGMSRLAIIDISPAGHQPMANPDKTIWIIYNGEVYNFLEERRALEAKGFHFQSTSDTEVVLRMYEYYGEDFLSRLRGMFALAIYDKRPGIGHEKLLLARDQVGIKPLMYAEVGGRFLFGSEMKALLASGLIQPEIDPESLRLLLTYGSVYQPRTMLRGVYMLLPAHKMVVQNGSRRVERYWTLGLDRCTEMRNLPYDELVDAVGEKLAESVRLQMVSDVPLGAFLSGGVDSSFLVGLMTRAAGRRIKTFSVGFGDEGAAIDETNDAERTARFLGSDHTRVVVTGEEVRKRIEHIAWGLDQPSVDGVNSYFVSLAARQSVTVSISGTGGDEVFTGYPWFTAMAWYQDDAARQPFRTAAKHWIASIADRPIFDSLMFKRSGPGLFAVRNRGGFVTRYANNYQIFGVLGAANIIAPDLKSGSGIGRAVSQDLRHIDELPHGEAIERVSALCLRGYTGNQLLRDIDATSMAHSLEVRVPYLDVPLIDLALSLPVSAKLGQVPRNLNPYTISYRESGSKKVLVDAGKRAGMLPEGIDQQPKRGFGMPFGAWLNHSLRSVLDDTLSPTVVRQRGLFSPQAVEEVRQSFIDGKSYWSYPWLLMMVELWCRQVLDPVRVNASGA
jgi:asparagine synthase (glutamine-hydrolysing)